MKQSATVLMSEIRGRLEMFDSHLPKNLDAFALSPDSKLPAKVLRYREALIWRVAELGRTAFHEFEGNRLISAIVMTRAVVETSAALWFLRAKVDDAIKSNVIGDIDTHLVKLSVGIATAPPKPEDGRDFPRPVRVGKLLDEVEKVIPGFNEHYGVLSEFAHPNWAGTVSLYSKFHPDLTVEFGQYVRSADQAKGLGVNSLHTALELFEVTYNNLTDSMPAFVELCRKHVTEQKESFEE